MVRVLFVIAAALWAAPALFAQVYRCGSTYQSSPCANGREIDVSAPVSAGAPDTDTVFLCKRYDGQRFWVPKPCHAYSRFMLERQVRVPAELLWAERLAYAERERLGAEALQRPPPLPKVAASSRQRSRGCEAYRDALERNASAARVGGSARYMDRLSEERRQIWKRMHKAGC